MARKRLSAEQIITMLREAEALLNPSNPVAEVCRKPGISEQTYYRWQKEYGGMRVDQARRLKELEQENARLKKLDVTTLFIEPGSLWENGYVESFIGKLRDELLNGEVLDTLDEAKVLVEAWHNAEGQISGPFFGGCHCD